MKRIQTCLWFNDQAEAAVKLYTAAFGHSKTGTTVRYGKSGEKVAGQPEGSVMTIEFELEGSSFLALNGGPHFKFNPSQSLFVGCESVEEIERLWKVLAHTPRMDLDRYPWAERYGWCEDRFGVQWQLMVGPRTPKISPALLFANGKLGKAEEALRFYASVFPRSKVQMIARDEKSGAVLHGVVDIDGQTIVAMEGPLEPEHDFSCAVSFILPCESQEELDTLWAKLSAHPAAEQCGWLADKYGVSWQAVGADWVKWVADATPEKRERLMTAMFAMKKPDLKKLRDSMR